MNGNTMLPELQGVLSQTDYIQIQTVMSWTTRILCGNEKLDLNK